MRFVSINGNWTVYWWKLEGLLTETWLLGGLLPQTGRSIDGNWMFSWRKLDGILTETVLSIDGNWTVYWLLMETFHQIFFILGRENRIFAEFWNPRFRGHLAFFISFSVFSRLENAIFPFTKRYKSHFFAAKMRKICLHEAWYTWTLGFTTEQKSHFVPSKM